MPMVAAQYASVQAALALMDMAMTAAIGLKGGGDGFAKSGMATVEFEAEKSASKQKLFNKMLPMQREFRAENTLNMQNGNCRLQTMQKTTTTLEARFEKTVAANLEDGLLDMFFSHNSPQRARVAALQRNCKNGQFAPADFGQKWWDAMASTGHPCFEDTTDADGDGRPDFLHAYASPNIVLDNLVMVPPTPTQMEVLNNPDGGGDPKAVWQSLGTRQKTYVSAVRYCENLALGALKPLSIQNDAALDPANAPIILQNFAAMAKLDTLIYACRAEIARRTAPDPAQVSATMPQFVASSKKIGEFLKRSGVNPALFQEGTKNYISPALLAYGRNNAFCNSPETQKSIQADSGTESEKTRIMQRCEQLKLTSSSTEAIYREAFSSMVAGLKGVSQEFTDGIQSPVRAEGKVLLQQANFKPETLPPDYDKSLLVLLRESDSGEQSASETVKGRP